MRAGSGTRGLAAAEPSGPLATLSPPALEAPERPRGRRPRPPEGAPPPPDRWDGDGGGGGGGGGGGSDGGSPGPEGRGISAVEFAFGFLLVAICTLFAAFLLAWAMMRQGPDWPEGDLDWQPRALWLSTALLLASELAMSRTARPGGRRRTRRRLALAAALGLGFLAAQGWTWMQLRAEGVDPTRPHGAIFYALTGLHGLHVVGGLAFMALLWARLARPAARHGPLPGLGLCRVYWHVMGGIWVVVFTVLYFGG